MGTYRYSKNLKLVEKWIYFVEIFYYVLEIFEAVSMPTFYLLYGKFIMFYSVND